MLPKDALPVKVEIPPPVGHVATHGAICECDGPARQSMTLPATVAAVADAAVAAVCQVARGVATHGATVVSATVPLDSMNCRRRCRLRCRRRRVELPLTVLFVQ